MNTKLVAVTLEITPWGLLAVASFAVLAGVAAWGVWRWRFPGVNYEVESAEIALEGIGSISIRPNRENIQIAHQAWVELVTRKAAIPFDGEHDVLLEIYDSWHELFQRLRELTKEIPAHKLRSCKNTRELANVLILVLNKGLRPHLTHWQARYRAWWERIGKDIDGSPQEAQRQFPGYAELEEDLKKINRELVKFASLLQRVSHGASNR